MSIKQYMAISRQTVRNALNWSPTYLFYKLKGKLEPVPDYKEDPTNEWAGQDLGQGYTEYLRNSSAWKFDWESRIFPSLELATLLEFLLGYKSTPVTLDTTATKVMFNTVSEMFSESSPLLDNALALVPHTDKGGTTYAQRFLGGRIKTGEIDFKGAEAVDLKLGFIGGPWISAPEQTAVSGVSFPAKKHFRYNHACCYLGSGASLVGTAPNYTDISPSTMARFKPDDMTIKFEVGIDDKYKMNNEDGPSFTERTAAWKITIEYTIDFSDPASGWSSYDAWFARFGDIQTAPFMLLLDSNELAGAATETCKFCLYLPKVMLANDAADRKNDGSKTKIKFTLTSLVDASVNVAAVAKLVY